MWFVLNGVFLIWLGSSLKKISRSTTMPGVFSGTGILVVIAGILHLTILPFAYVVTQSLTILAMLPLTYLLLKAE
jgi:protein-S-isoprenylcysteine O-methyltransferase Ste14